MKYSVQSLYNGRNHSPRCAIFLISILFTNLETYFIDQDYNQPLNFILDEGAVLQFQFS